MSLDPLPPFAQAALLLDLDGTLVDIAPTPEAVVVAPGLTDTLCALRRHLNDAVAIVTGRPIETVDRLLGRAPWAVAGEHGGAIRRQPDAAIERPDLPGAPANWLDVAAALADANKGALLERKARGFALHYRNAPAAGPLFGGALRDLIDDRFDLLAGHMVWEVRPHGANKGVAVERLMQSPPFVQRLPVFIGDDVTDEDGMRVARQMGGAGLRVDAAFGTPGDVRAWLRKAAMAGDWPELPRA